MRAAPSLAGRRARRGRLRLIGQRKRCSPRTEAIREPSPPAGDPSSDKLAQVSARGTLILFTDPAYPPQSFAVKGAKRLRHQVRREPAHRQPDHGLRRRDRQARGEGARRRAVLRDAVVDRGDRGNWGDRWDLAYGSGAVALDRMDVLYMTQPYYSTPTNFFVPAARRRRRRRTSRASGSAPAPAARWRSTCAARSSCPGRRSSGS